MKENSLTLKQQSLWIVGHWKPYRKEISHLLMLTVANAVVLMFYPYMMKRVIEGVEQSLSVQRLLQDVLVFFLISFVHFLIYWWMQTLRVQLNLAFEFAIRMRGFESLLRMGSAFFGTFRTGDLITRLNDDVNGKLSWYMCSGIFRVVEAIGIIVTGLFMMWWINPTLTLYTAGPLPVLVALFVLTGSQLHRKYAAVQKSISELNDSLESCFSGIRVIKAFAAEDNQQQLVNEAIERQRAAEIQAVRWQTLIDALYGNIWQLAIVGVLLAGGAMAIAQEVSLGDIVAFETYVMLLAYPMFDVGQFLVRGRLSAVSIDRINELEQFEPEVHDRQRSPVSARRPDHEPPEDYTVTNQAQLLMRSI